MKTALGAVGGGGGGQDPRKPIKLENAHAFDSIANELLLMIFEYLNKADLMALRRQNNNLADLVKYYMTRNPIVFESVMGTERAKRRLLAAYDALAAENARIDATAPDGGLGDPEGFMNGPRMARIVYTLARMDALYHYFRQTPYRELQAPPSSGSAAQDSIYTPCVQAALFSYNLRRRAIPAENRSIMLLAFIIALFAVYLYFVDLGDPSNHIGGGLK